MILPRKTKQWAKEAIDALKLAWQLAEAEHGELNHQAKEHLYKYGPMFCAKNRRIREKSNIKAMAEYAIRDRFEDFEIDPEAKNNYSINFLLAYLDSHVYLKLLSKNKVHEIMEFITENYEIPEWA